MSKPVIRINFKSNGAVVFSHISLNGFKRYRILHNFIEPDIQKHMMKSFYRLVLRAVENDENLLSTCEVCGTAPAGECDHPKNAYCAKLNESKNK